MFYFCIFEIKKVFNYLLILKETIIFRTKFLKVNIFLGLLYMLRYLLTVEPNSQINI